MTTPVPLEILSPELLPDEKIEWTGRPNPSVIFQREDWFVIPFSLMWGGFAIFWLLGASGIWDMWTSHPNRSLQYFGLVWGTPFVLAGQYFIWGRFVYRRWMKKRTYYALTTRRALILRSGVRGRSSSSAYFENIPIIDKRVRPDGNGSVRFGAPITGEWQWGKTPSPRPFTFDDVDEADSVYRTVISLQDQARKSEKPSRWTA